MLVQIPTDNQTKIPPSQLRSAVRSPQAGNASVNEVGACYLSRISLLLVVSLQVGGIPGLLRGDVAARSRRNVAQRWVGIVIINLRTITALIVLRFDVVE